MDKRYDPMMDSRMTHGKHMKDQWASTIDTWETPGRCMDWNLKSTDIAWVTDEMAMDIP